jgi:hypothetical protein
MQETRSRRSLVTTLAVVIAGLGAGAPARAADFQVLTVGKVAKFEHRGDPARNGGVVTVGRDRALQTLYPPTCPATSAVEIEAYLQSTLRDAVLAHVDLDCAKWSAKGQNFQYTDPTGTVRSIRYGSGGLRIEIRGAGFTPISGPVAFVQAQLQISDRILRARFHSFKQNDAQKVITRKPSTAAAAGEAGFWDVMIGDDSSEAREQEVIGTLEKAITGSRLDGRSRFLLGMIRMYRFGQQVTHFESVSAETRAELVAANTAFAAAVPLLWDEASATGDSRVPGFAAAAKYTLGAVDDDAALRAQGLADLERAVQVNSFFNVFDLIPVLQILPPSDPVFQQTFALVTTYLSDPATLQCVVTQPELCAGAGFAPRNVQGSLTLFGDLYAKAGDLGQAQAWYGLASAFPDTASWPFVSVIQDRTTNAAARVALYKDSDPSNDPPIIGAGAEACAFCHQR